MNYLVPIDFSAQSKVAAEYAASLTRTWPGNLQLAHVIIPVEEEQSYIPVKTMNVKKNTVFELFNFQEQIRRSSGVRSGAEIVSGEFASKILKIGAREKSDLIVMGMQGMSGLRDFLYGSNTMRLIEESTLTVLAVPAEAQFKPFRHIVYVTDYRREELTNLTALGKIAAKFKAVLSVISINSDVEDIDRLEFRSALRASIPFAAVNFEDRTDAEGVARGLQGFALTQSVDLIGVSAAKTELVRKMAGRSLSEEMTFQVEAPVLFFPS